MINLIKGMIANRDLISELVSKDLKVRYSSVALGFIWALLAPLFMAGVIFLVFSLFLKVEIKEAPFMIYLMSAVFTWRFFQEGLTSAATSLVDNKNLLKDSTLPHYCIPVSVVLAQAINFLPALIIFVIFSGVVLRGFSAFLVFLPVVFLIQLTMTLGLAVALAVWYVKWRDVKYILESVLLLLFYAIPVFYSLDLVKNSLKPGLFQAYISDPLVGILCLYRITTIKGYYAAITGSAGFWFLAVIPLVFSLFSLAAAGSIYGRNKDQINDYLNY